MAFSTPVVVARTDGRLEGRESGWQGGRLREEIISVGVLGGFGRGRGCRHPFCGTCGTQGLPHGGVVDGGGVRGGGGGSRGRAGERGGSKIPEHIF